MLGPVPMKVLLFAHDSARVADDALLALLGGDCQKGPLHNDAVECYSVGTTGAAPLARLIAWSLKAIWTRFRHDVRTLCFSPSGPNRRGLYQDWLVMALCRP